MITPSNRERHPHETRGGCLCLVECDPTHLTMRGSGFVIMNSSILWMQMLGDDALGALGRYFSRDAGRSDGGGARPGAVRVALRWALRGIQLALLGGHDG